MATSKAPAKKKQEHIFELSGTIPTVQYGNLMPVVKGIGNSPEEARDNALDQMKEIWNNVCEPGRELKIRGDSSTFVQQSESTVLLRSAINETEVLFDEHNHIYYTKDGSNTYTGGSTYAKKFTDKFDSQLITLKMATKHEGVTPESIQDMWAKNGEVSSTYGSALHAALELRGKYSDLSMTLKGSLEYVTSKNPIISSVVDNFFEGREDEDARYEVFIADEETLSCGSIDRLLVVNKEEKIVRVQDFKTNYDIFKKKKILEPYAGLVDKNELGYYWIQLSFYAAILEKYGYTVEGLDIFWLNPSGNMWVEHSHDVLEVAL